jgi:predicted ribosomally synthesized peptide with SipW-like signal peptide
MPPKHFITMGGEPVAAARRWVGDHPVRFAVGLVAASALTVGIGATTASFSDEVKVTAEVGAGSLDIQVNGAQGNPTPIVLTLPEGSDQLKPGATVNQQVALQNVGTLPARMSLVLKGQGVTYLGSQLDATLTVTPSTGTPTKFTSKAANLALEPFLVGAGETVPVDLALTLPTSTDNSWQGKTDTLTLTLTAVQG